MKYIKFYPFVDTVQLSRKQVLRDRCDALKLMICEEIEEIDRMMDIHKKYASFYNSLNGSVKSDENR